MVKSLFQGIKSARWVKNKFNMNAAYQCHCFCLLPITTITYNITHLLDNHYHLAIVLLTAIVVIEVLVKARLVKARLVKARLVKATRVIVLTVRVS